MLTASLIAALFVLCLACAGLTGQNARLRAQIVRQQIAGRSNDEDVVAQLEASAEVSPLARRLLAAAREPEKPLAAPPDWRHDPSAPTPVEERWQIFLRDMELEADDDGRLTCLRRCVERGERFTAHEQVEVAALFQSTGGRDAARAMFAGKRDERKVWAYVYHLRDGNACHWEINIDRFASEDEVRGRAAAKMDERQKAENLTNPIKKILVMALKD